MRDITVDSKAFVKRAWLVVPLLAALILSPTLMNGQPFIFWDTAQYYHYGAKLVGFARDKTSGWIGLNQHPPTPGQGISAPETNSGTPVDKAAPTEAVPIEKSSGIAFFGARSPFYSVLLYSMAQFFGLWSMVILQALAIAWIISRVAWLADSQQPFKVAAAIAALAILPSGAWFSVGFVMPDIYAASALACIALLFSYSDRMSRIERVSFGALLATSALFHSTHLVTSLAIVTVGGTAAFWLFAHRNRQLAGGWAAAAIALAVAVLLQLAFDVAARSAIGVSPKRPPFLMARVIADGPGRVYLNSICPSDPKFTACAVRNYTFESADELLWSGVPGKGGFQTFSVDERIKLIAEEPQFVISVFLHDPLAMIRAAIGNAWQQLALFSPTEAWIDPGQSFSDLAFREVNLFEVAPFLNSCIENLGSCLPKVPEALVAPIAGLALILALIAIGIHLIAYGSPAGAASFRYPRHDRAVLFTFIIVLGVIINAALCGAVSGPHPRYNARLIWLLIVCAMLLEIAWPIITTRARHLIDYKRAV